MSNVDFRARDARFALASSCADAAVTRLPMHYPRFRVMAADGGAEALTMFAHCAMLNALASHHVCRAAEKPYPQEG